VSAARLYRVVDESGAEVDMARLVREVHAAYEEGWAKGLIPFDVSGFVADEDGELYVMDDTGIAVAAPPGWRAERVPGMRLCLHERVTVGTNGAATCDLCGVTGPLNALLQDAAVKRVLP